MGLVFLLFIVTLELLADLLREYYTELLLVVALIILFRPCSLQIWINIPIIFSGYNNWKRQRKKRNS